MSKTEISTDVKPTWLAEKEKVGLEDVKKHIVPSSLRIIQALSSDDLKEKFNEGEAVLLPEGIAFANKDEQVLVTPVYFYNEFVAWNPRDHQPRIRERSRDESSELARKCRTDELRVEEIDGVEVKNLEHLNYMCVIHHEDAPSIPCIVSFCSAEHMTGRKWSNMISARGESIFAGIYAIGTTQNSNAKGRWFGFDIENAGWVSDEQYALFEKLHGELESKDIQADYVEEPGESDATSDTSGASEAASQF